MDDAQNDFEFEEFQAFKKTLKGFEKHWRNIKNDVYNQIRKMGER